ncbi:MAG: zinc ribbon domain-containing protein [Deltaproteobacteria bacterium]|nr:zinc ribbon domain-containing protein [Deltaproteobacteria bacterium]
MPIYEYQCTKCGHCEEVLQKFSDPLVSECPQCSGSMKKLMSMNSFHLKGSGWYVTDYASKNKASASPAAASAGSEGGSDSSPTTKDAGASSKTESSGSPGKTSKE